MKTSWSASKDLNPSRFLIFCEEVEHDDIWFIFRSGERDRGRRWPELTGDVLWLAVNIKVEKEIPMKSLEI